MIPRAACWRERGQATIELVAFVPVLVVVVAAVVQVLAAGSAHERASAAAEAGAVAMLQDGDPKDAIERSLGPAAERSTVVIDGRHIRVTVRPRAFARPVGELLSASSEADAGVEAESVARTVVRGGDGEDSRPEAEARRRASNRRPAPPAGPAPPPAGSAPPAGPAARGGAHSVPSGAHADEAGP